MHPLPAMFPSAPHHFNELHNTMTLQEPSR